ncbi:hypothetical protein BpHYR1_045565 [Brachionus plicatilis]|uniref:Uncharacterized protein n=1 Tax=Brachionus plicatilis TaxID=10195 RepID=A0A3M7QMA9_BRAPC|nr:hypothetical protein BpHYR1_045565 [Brachionus plicatilis]
MYLNNPFKLIFIFFCLSSPALSINSTLECSSTNDPHMINFKKVAFEFHHGGIFPLYESIYVKINAGFNPCSAYSQAFCNCLIEIELYTGEYVLVNNCYGIDSYIQTDMDNLDCYTLIDHNLLFSELAWQTVPAYHRSFKCATTPTNSLAIRTTLTSERNDVLILLYKSEDIIDQIKIYPSDNYAIDSMQDFDKSLCGSYDRIDVPKIETNKIEIDVAFKTKCKEVLVDKCVEEVVLPSQMVSLESRISKLVEDCALDASIGSESIGKFQIALFEQTVYEELTKNFKRSYCTSGTCLSEQAFLILRKFCYCKKMRPNSLCLIDQKCSGAFTLCI